MMSMSFWLQLGFTGGKKNAHHCKNYLLLNKIMSFHGRPNDDAKKSRPQSNLNPIVKLGFRPTVILPQSQPRPGPNLKTDRQIRFHGQAQGVTRPSIQLSPSTQLHSPPVQFTKPQPPPVASAKVNMKSLRFVSPKPPPPRHPLVKPIISGSISTQPSLKPVSQLRPNPVFKAAPTIKPSPLIKPVPIIKPTVSIRVNQNHHQSGIVKLVINESKESNDSPPSDTTPNNNNNNNNNTAIDQEPPRKTSELHNSPTTAYVINLDSRKDRWEAIQTNFKTINSIQLVRFSAIVEKPGFIGCGKSHLKLIQLAKEREEPFVMILEDDAIIKNPTTFEEQWNSILTWLKNHLNEWDVFNGGPGFWSGGAGVNKIIDLDRRLVDIRGGLCTHFVCYSSRAYDKLLTWTPSMGPIDVFISNKCTVLSTYPLLSIQRPSYSNLWNHHTDYTGRYNYAEHIIKAALTRPK
jgi:hypothetical protein